MRPCLAAIALLLGMILQPPALMAHKVIVFAWVEEGTVYTESKFSGGKRVKGGKIEAFDHTGQRVVEGITDEDGRFDFNLPRGARHLKVVMTSGMGHTNHWTITPEELGLKTPASDNIKPGIPVRASGDGAAPTLDAGMIEEIVERTLERKLAPLRAQMAEQSWGLRDIVAGLGYILGLMGLASYLHHRNKQAAASPETDL